MFGPQAPIRSFLEKLRAQEHPDVARTARLAKLAQSLVNFEKPRAAHLPIIAGQAAMRECQHKRLGDAKDISE